MIDFPEILNLREAGLFDELTARGVTMSGGNANQMEAGWLKAPFAGRKAHYFEQDKEFGAIGAGGRVRFWNSLCGVFSSTNDRAPMFFAGNYSHCKNCAQKLIPRSAV